MHHFHDKGQHLCGIVEASHLWIVQERVQGELLAHHALNPRTPGAYVKGNVPAVFANPIELLPRIREFLHVGHVGLLQQVWVSCWSVLAMEQVSAELGLSKAVHAQRCMKKRVYVLM